MAVRRLLAATGTLLFCVGSAGCARSEGTGSEQRVAVTRQPMVTADTVVLRASGADYEIEIYSVSAFPPGAYDPVLHIGSHTFSRFRYLPVTDYQGIAFKIPAADFAALNDGETLSVGYEDSTARSFGTLNKASVVPAGTP